MRISEILQSSPEVIISKIGKGPYLYYDNDPEKKIIIECSLERILNYYTKNGQVLYDIEIYAYGFKKDENDELQYINADDLKKRFRQMEQNDVYESIEPEESNGEILYVPSYCSFDVLLYLDENNIDMIVNCKPIKDVIKEEFERRIEISNSIRQ